MGLDMYLRGEKFFWTDWKEPKNNRTEDGFQLSEMSLELGYWRKHPNLHGFIVKTFANGEDDCQPIGLDEAQIDKIIEAIKSEGLPHTEGFFFGKSDLSAEEREADIAILTKAKAWLATKEPNVSRTVSYRASW